jgi:chaperone modulatory protein CbpM
MMSGSGFIRVVDYEMNDLVTIEMVAEAAGTTTTRLSRLARLGLLETIGGEHDEVLLPTRAILRVRKMQRLHRDLGVNFTGAAIILDMLENIRDLKRGRGGMA